MSIFEKGKDCGLTRQIVQRKCQECGELLSFLHYDNICKDCKRKQDTDLKGEKQMKNQAEIYKALLDGKKITHNSWNSGGYLYLNKNGTVSDQDEEIKDHYAFACVKEWSIFECKYTFTEAVKLMKEGKKMTCPKDLDNYIRIDSDYMVLPDDEVYIPSYQEMIERKWTIYEESQSDKDFDEIHIDENSITDLKTGKKAIFAADDKIIAP